MIKPHPRPRNNSPKRTVSIIGTGSYVPERILTNADLEKSVETTDEWITTRTGIKERRIAADGEFTSDMAAKAARSSALMAANTAFSASLMLWYNAFCSAGSAAIAAAPSVSPTTPICRIIFLRSSGLMAWYAARSSALMLAKAACSGVAVR